MAKRKEKWGQMILLVALATLATRFLLDAAGLPAAGQFNLSQWIVYALCFGAIWKALEVVVDIAVIAVRPPAPGR